MAVNQDVSEPTLSVRKTPILAPIPESRPAPRPELTADQQAKYEALLTKARSWTDVAVAASSGSDKNKDPERPSGGSSGPVTDGERAWLTRECLLRYLRATRWSVDEAARRVQATLSWRREYGLSADDDADDGAAAAAAYIEPEQVTGKQVIVGYDRVGRPCHYLIPGRQNTDASPRQVRHLFYMVERVADLMPAGVEQLCLIIDFKSSRNRPNTSVPISMAREVLHILQNHYPERLGKALIINVPWIVWGFFKIITPFIDPVTRDKLKFNEDMTQYVPPEQLWGLSCPGGAMEFSYDHDVYWPALSELCAERRRVRLARWRAAGGVVGESEDYLAGGTDTSVTGFRHVDGEAGLSQKLTGNETGLGENVIGGENGLAEKLEAAKLHDGPSTEPEPETQAAAAAVA